MKIGIIVESRMASTRLPGKILLPILGKPALELMVERLKRVKEADEIIIATTDKDCDLVIVDFAKKWNLKFFRGSEENVLSRVLKAAKQFAIDVIVEITSDCPLIDPDIISDCINRFLDSNVDYLSNVILRTYPRGLDVQVFKTAVLEKIDSLTEDPAHREHVTLYIYEHSERYKLMNVSAESGLQLAEQRLTLDTSYDYFVIREIFEKLYPENKHFGYKDIYNFLMKHPEIRKINSHIEQKNTRNCDFAAKARTQLGLK